MGWIKRSFQDLSKILPIEIKQNALQLLPSWSNTRQTPPWDYNRLAVDGHRKNALVYACITKLAVNAADPPMLVYKDIEGADEPVYGHPLSLLLERPNPLVSRFEFWEIFFITLMLCGNVFVFKERNRGNKVIALWLLRPDRMEIIPDPVNMIKGYIYRPDGRIQQLEAKDVIHYKLYDPINDFWGKPPIMSAASEIDIRNAMSSFLYSFFENAGVPYGLFKVKGHATESQIERLQDRWKTLHNGPMGWHKIAIIDEDASYQQMGTSIGTRELAMKELANLTDASICMSLGVPPQVISAYVGMQHMIYHNYSEARKAFWAETIMPLLSRVASRFTLDLLSEFDSSGKMKLFHDLSNVDALQEDISDKAKREREDYLAGGSTLNEYRASRGLPNIEGGDVIVVPGNTLLVPVTNLGKIPDVPDSERRSERTNNGSIPPRTVNGGEI